VRRGGRPIPSGRPRITTLIVVGLVIGVRLSGQTSFHATVGARYTSPLVHDSIVTPLDVRAAVAPALVVALDLPLDGPWKLELLADLATSPVRRHDAGGATTPITRVWTIGLGLGLRRRLESWLDARLAVGALKYVPTASIGLFRDGGGSVTPYGSLAFDIAPPVAARHRVALEVAGDMHRFLTPALRRAGFVDSRVVYRVTAGVRVDLWRTQ
jgi:hypothetical protein